MAYFAARWMYVVHVGDSRCYLIRDDKIHLLTRDHSVAQLLVEAGQLDEATAEISPLSHCLYNSIGGNSSNPMAPDVSKSELFPGDVVLLCTDGLTRHVSDESILAVLGQVGSVEEKNMELVNLANEDGGSDNITVVQAVWQEDSNRLANDEAEAETVDFAG